MNVNAELALGCVIGAAAFAIYVVAFPLQIVRRRIHLLRLEVLRARFLLEVATERLSRRDPDVRFVWSVLNVDLEPIGESSFLRAEKQIESLVMNEELRQLTSGEIAKELDRIAARPDLSPFVQEMMQVVIGIGSTFTILMIFFYSDEWSQELRRMMKQFRESLRTGLRTQEAAT